MDMETQNPLNSGEILIRNKDKKAVLKKVHLAIYITQYQYILLWYMAIQSNTNLENQNI